MAGPYPNDQGQAAGAIPVWVTAGPAGNSGAGYKNITTNTSILVKTGAGVLLGLSINQPGGGSTVVIYDGINNTGAVVGTFNTAGGASSPNLPMTGVGLSTGLFAVTTGSSPADITLYYK